MLNEKIREEASFCVCFFYQILFPWQVPPRVLNPNAALVTECLLVLNPNATLVNESLLVL